MGKVFAPIEKEMHDQCSVDSIYMPAVGYGVRSMWRNISAVRRQLRHAHYDVVHITGTENYLLPFLREYRTVVTMHDVGSLLGGVGGVRRWVKSLLFIQTLRLADIVTFISEQSCRETCEIISLSEGRFAVVSNPVDPNYRYSPREFCEVLPTVLHIGTKPNKNLARTVAALVDIPCRLRIIGRLTPQDREMLERSGVNFSNAFDLDDEQMLREYEGCDIVSFASTYEGFGMPIIEGQAVGRVVVTSNISPMKEVAGGGAVLVDPFDCESIKRGFEEAIANHEDYVSQGRESVKKYKVSEIAKKYISLYAKLSI